MPQHLQNLEELRQLHDLHHMEAIHGPGAQGPALASLVKPLLGLALVGSWLATLGLGLDEAGRGERRSLAQRDQVFDELYGVDISASTVLKELEVRRAADFAAWAHRGQKRKTGEDYVSHCVATAKIVESLLPQVEGLAKERLQAPVIAALLHDCLEDTEVTKDLVEERFGPEVATLVSGVSQLSMVNQLLRRKRRTDAASEEAVHLKLSKEEEKELRTLILSMVDEPLVLVIKLADRLHNMRTLYALKPAKQRAIALETRSVWCSLAERLGVFSIKAELEDLSFAILEPHRFSDTLNQLCEFWDTCADDEDAACAVPPDDLTPSQLGVKRNLESVVPFDAQVFQKLGSRAALPEAERVPPYVEAGLQKLRESKAALAMKLDLDAIIPGVDIQFQGRMKSIYSIHKKIRRKHVGLREIYDILALRVVVADDNPAALQACYRLLSAVNSLWRPIKGEIDDYIANPKPSGYQSLHTAVKTPGKIPLEVQIRTSSMHSYAEYGDAAHWMYKEVYVSQAPKSETYSIEQGELLVGQPVLRVSDSRLLDGAILRHTVQDDGARLLVAVFTKGRLRDQAALLGGVTQSQLENYRNVLRKVRAEKWTQPGQGNNKIVLEEYTLCKDGRFHKQDSYGYKLKTYVTPLQVLDDAAVEAQPPVGVMTEQQKEMRDKVYMLRSLLEWEEDIEDNLQISAVDRSKEKDDVIVLLWPTGSIARFPRGITAGEMQDSLALTLSLDVEMPGYDVPRTSTQRVFKVNDKIVPASTEVKDGDLVSII